MTTRPVVAFIRQDGLIELNCTSCQPVRSEHYFDWHHFFSFAVARLQNGGHYVCCKRCGAGNAVYPQAPLHEPEDRHTTTAMKRAG